MGILNDHDPVETQEWVDSLRAVLQHAGPHRARHLLTKLREEALLTGTMPPFLATTPYFNTIRPEREEKSSGDRELEHRSVRDATDAERTHPEPVTDPAGNTNEHGDADAHADGDRRAG